MRLQKYLAEAGVASRRASEQIILAGRVTVNDQVIRKLGTRVEPGRDRVAVDGQTLKAKRKLYLALHKPPGYLCTRRDPFERQTITGLLPKEWQHVSSVGRLDRDSEGLILLTNDGEFALRMTHPRYGVRKIYRATVDGRIEPPTLARLLEGINDAGELLKADKARLVSSNNTRSVVELELTEGKNREVRRLLEVVGFPVVRLQRTQIGRIKLGELPAGKWRTLTEPEIKSLLAPL